MPDLLLLRQFPSEKEARETYEGLARRLAAGRGADVSASLAVDADSATAFVVVFGDDAEHVRRQAQLIGGQQADPALLGPEMTAGLWRRRAAAALALPDGGGVRVDAGTPSYVQADGTLKPL